MQIDLYLYTVGQHPPVFSVGDIVLQSGVDLVEPLSVRLRSEKDRNKREGLVLLASELLCQLRVTNAGAAAINDLSSAIGGIRPALSDDWVLGITQNALRGECPVFRWPPK
jgi:hypothetical protein